MPACLIDNQDGMSAGVDGAGAIIDRIASAHSAETSAQPRSRDLGSAPLIEKRLNFWKLLAKFICYNARFLRIVHDMRRDQHHQFGAVVLIVVIVE